VEDVAVLVDDPHALVVRVGFWVGGVEGVVPFGHEVGSWEDGALTEDSGEDGCGGRISLADLYGFVGEADRWEEEEDQEEGFFQGGLRLSYLAPTTVPHRRQGVIW
jgi:hypothetical protein